MKSKILYFLQMLLAIIISAPLSVFLMQLSSYLMDPQGYNDNLANNMAGYVIYTIIFFIIYIVIGIPTTLLADKLKNKSNLISKFKSRYIIQFLTYTCASLMIPIVTLAILYSPASSLGTFFPAQVYLHILLLLRIRRKKNTKEVELSS
jgi:heme/copper-type cytochrome/quinol oxidase subunit 2